MSLPNIPHNLIPHFILNQHEVGAYNGRFPATALFVDISGFSTMTDALMTHGQHGAEVLAMVMNNVFTPLVQCVYEQGGFIIGFAGDAFTAVFPNSPLHALAAAWRCQQHMQVNQDQETVYGHFTMFAKIGAALGEVDWGIVMAADGSRASYYFRGTAVDGCTQAEHLCQAGDIVVDTAVFEAINEWIATEPVNGHFRVRAVTKTLPEAQPVNLSPVSLDTLSHFFPTTLIAQSHPGEFRQVVNLFISLPTVRTEAQLNIFMQSLFALQERYGGLLNRLDFGDKGAHLVLFWGAPVTYENDVERALNFILDLQSQTSIPINAGITYQIAHAGFIGSALYEEYTCYGRGVNLAARFMSRAPRGEIWVDANIARQAAAHFDIEFEGEQSFKGFAQPQKVYVLWQHKEGMTSLYEGHLVGREKELAQLRAFIQPIFQEQHAGTLIVWGEPGIGKSRLIHEFRTSSLFQEQAVLWATCQADEILRQSLNPFRYWLRRYFDQSVEHSELRNKRNFNRKLDGLIGVTVGATLAQELDRTRSFLGVLVGLSWPDSLYEQLDAKRRYENTFAGLTAMLKAESQRQPLVLFIEDAHWLDDDSKAYLPRLTRALAGGNQPYPIAILATARFEGTGLPLGEALAGEEIDLKGLTRSEVAHLAENILNNPVSPGVLDHLIQRAEGNPFFAEQIVHYLLEEGLLEQQGTIWAMADKAAKTAIPTDIRAMLASRVDSLTQAVKEVVQTASVLGREFEVRLLAWMLQGDETLNQKIKQAEQSAIWLALSEIHYIFKHALLRDTVYRMQLRRQRQALHALALQALESLHADDMGRVYGELAYHAWMAELNDEAFRYSIAAGDVAFATYATQEALDHFNRALDIASRMQERGESIEVTMLSQLYQERGQALMLVSDDEAVESNYEAMRALAVQRQDRALELEALLSLSNLYGHYTSLFNPVKAGKMAQEALVLARELGDRAAEARSLWGLMIVEVTVVGDNNLGMSYGRQALALARELGLKELVGHILNGFCWPLFYLNQVEQAREALRESLSIWRELGNLQRLAEASRFMAMINHNIGDHRSVVAEAPALIELSASISSHFDMAQAATHLTSAHARQGRLAQALAYAEKVGDLSTTTGHAMEEQIHQYVRIQLYLAVGAWAEADRWADRLYAQRELLVPAVRQLFPAFVALAWIAYGKLGEAQAILDEQVANVAKDGVASFTIIPVAIGYGYLNLALGKPEALFAGLEEQVRSYREAGFVRLLADEYWLRGRAEIALGQYEAAREALLKARDAAEAQEERAVLWQILVSLAEVEEACGDGETAERLRDEAREVVGYIADHAGELREVFLERPEVQLIRRAE